MEFIFKPIGFIHTPFKNTESIPKTFGVAPAAEGIVEILSEYADGLLQIESFSHLILIFAFHQSRDKPLKVIPPTQDKERGVFSSRSPGRPNAIGILTVRLIKREQEKLYVEGVDLLLTGRRFLILNLTYCILIVDRWQRLEFKLLSSPLVDKLGLYGLSRESQNEI